MKRLQGVRNEIKKQESSTQWKDEHTQEVGTLSDLFKSWAKEAKGENKK